MKTHLWLSTITALFFCCATMPVSAQTSPQQRMKGCAQEWNAMKAANQTAGRSYRDFERECLAKRPASSSTVGSASPLPGAPPARTAARTRSATATPSGAGDAGQAQRNCPSESVVWVNTATKVYHFSGSRLYGTTKEGTYMCQSASERAGFRAAKNEKPK